MDDEVINLTCGKPLSEDNSTIQINNSYFSYSISKSEKEKGIKIKLYESQPKTNIYYEYEATISQLTNSIKTLLICEDLDEMITTLKAAFDEKRAKFLEEKDKSFIEFNFKAIGKSKTYKIEFKKYEPKDTLTEINDKITAIHNDCKNLYNEIEELKKAKIDDIDIKEKIREVLQEKDMKMKLYEEFEQILCLKFNFVNTKKESDINNNNLIDIENSVKEISKNELMKKVDETEFKEKISNIEEQLNKKTNDLIEIKSLLDNFGNSYISKKDLNSEINKNIQNNEIIQKISENINSIKNNTNNNNNSIEIKIKIDKDKVGRQIKFLQQSSTYKYFFNFERDDIELIIDGENSSLDNFKPTEEFKSDEKSKYCFKAQEIEYNLKNGFNFYLCFNTSGIHTIKILFRKKLYDCSFLFNNCENIIEVDLSNFDCSQVTSCESMFDNCKSLKVINLGKLDFSLCKNFKSMFNECRYLENIDVSNFNTKNSETFEYMFYGCRKLKNIDVSKFNSSKCITINSIFRYCENLSEINMINWDMSRLKNKRGGFLFLSRISGINYLFDGCKSLKNIKMSSNFSKDLIEDKDKNIFTGLPKSGTFTWKKGINCDSLLKLLPVSWNRVTE